MARWSMRLGVERLDASFWFKLRNYVKACRGLTLLTEALLHGKTFSRPWDESEGGKSRLTHCRKGGCGSLCFTSCDSMHGQGVKF